MTHSEMMESQLAKVWQNKPNGNSGALAHEEY